MGLLKRCSSALLSVQLNIIEVLHEMRGSMREALKQNLLLS